MMNISEQPEKRQSLNVEGNLLEIIAHRISEGEWSLCVENCYGIRSHWFECFVSADAALEEGRKAIIEEGVEAFLSTEDFDFSA